MSKPLTSAAVEKLRPGKHRIEISDGGNGLFLVIQPTGSKSWALRFRRPGGRPAKLALGSVYIKSTGTREPDSAPIIGGHLTLAAARRLTGELRHEIAQGRDPARDHIVSRQRGRAAGNSSTRLFAGAARKFIDDYKVPKKGRKPRRWQEIARILGWEYAEEGCEPIQIKNGLAERWADKPIGEIDSADIHALIEESLQSGLPGMKAREGVSDARGRKMADALGSMFKWLMRGRLIKANPCFGAYRPDAPNARDRVLSDSEIANFWRAAGTLNEPFGQLLKLLLLSGCRLNEVAGMRWDELDGDVWTIPASRTKNGRPHVVPLNKLVLDLIASIHRRENSEFAFTTTGRSPVSGWSKTKIRLDKAMNNTAPWRLHDLRRTAATGMAELGIAPHIVEAALNHVSGAKAGVAGTYNRAAYSQEKKAALDLWASHVEQLTRPRGPK
jgi:integrase